MIKLSDLIEEAHQIQEDRDLLRRIRNAFKDVNNAAELTEPSGGSFPGDRVQIGSVFIHGSAAYMKLKRLIEDVND